MPASICLCVNLRHLRIPPEKLASFVTVFTIEDKLEGSSQLSRRPTREKLGNYCRDSFKKTKEKFRIGKNGLKTLARYVLDDTALHRLA